MLTRCARFAVGRPYLTLALTALLVVGCIVSGSRVEVDNHLTGMLPPEHPTTQANQLIDHRLGGLLPLDIEIDGPVGKLVELSKKSKPLGARPTKKGSEAEEAEAAEEGE